MTAARVSGGSGRRSHASTNGFAVTPSALSRNHPGLLARSGPPSLDSVHLVRVLQFLSRENGSIGARQSSSPNDGRGRRIHGPPRVETATALTVATTPHPAGVREPRFRRPFPHIHIFLGGPLFESTSGSFLPSGEAHTRGYVQPVVFGAKEVPSRHTIRARTDAAVVTAPAHAPSGSTNPEPNHGLHPTALGAIVKRRG
jgi:hypothetical protein